MSLYMAAGIPVEVRSVGGKIEGSRSSLLSWLAMVEKGRTRRLKAYSRSLNSTVSLDRSMIVWMQNSEL